MRNPESLNWENLNKSLLETFPVLQNSEYAEIIGGFEGWEPGPYILLGSLFNRYLVESTSREKETREKIAIFIEDMACARDFNVSDLLQTEILPTLIENQARLNEYWSSLGPRTKDKLRLLAALHHKHIILPDK